MIIIASVARKNSGIFPVDFRVYIKYNFDPRIDLLHSGKVIPLEVKPGDKVLFTKYAPNEIKVEDKEYLIAKEEDILAIIE